MYHQAGARAIHTAALTGHAGVINALIQKGENVDATTRVRRHLEGTQRTHSPGVFSDIPLLSVFLHTTGRMNNYLCTDPSRSALKII